MKHEFYTTVFSGCANYFFQETIKTNFALITD